MPKRSKGKGTRAAKVTKARATRASSGGSRPQQSGRSEGEDALSSSVIGREDVALVVEVLKTLRQRDVASSGPDRNGGTPSSGTTSEREATSLRSQAVGDLHLPG